MFDPTQPDTVTLSGTFHANPVALAAGIETLKATTPEAIAESQPPGAAGCMTI